MQKVSIVIPTRNRTKTLLTALNSLSIQTVPKEDYEVIVIDNSSDDKTEKGLENYRNNSLDFRYFKINQPSASKARNIGILNAKYDLILHTDDDIIATENLLEEHLKFHKNLNFNSNIAVLGYTTWHNSLKITCFMRFINEYGPQFGYSLIKDEDDLPFNYFYSSNISISKKFLVENIGFDEDFPEYWYDIELGYRLMKKGLKIILNRNAVAYHLHPTSFFSFLKRQQKVGRYAVLFYLKHPKLKNFLFLENKLSSFPKLITKKEFFYSSLIYEFYNTVIRIYYKNGTKLGMRNFIV